MPFLLHSNSFLIIGRTRTYSQCPPTVANATQGKCVPGTWKKGRRPDPVQQTENVKVDSAKKQTAALLQRKSPPSEPARDLRSAAACPCRRYCSRIHLTPHIAASWSCSQVKVLYAKRPRQLMRRGKGIYARGSSGKAGGVIRHCRKVKANRGSVFQPPLRMAGLPITLRSLVQCAAALLSQH